MSRRRVRRRRLIAAVVAIDLTGIAALAIALTRNAHHPPTTTASTAVARTPLAHPQTPQTLMVVATCSGPGVDVKYGLNGREVRSSDLLTRIRAGVYVWC